MNAASVVTCEPPALMPHLIDLGPGTALKCPADSLARGTDRCRGLKRANVLISQRLDDKPNRSLQLRLGWGLSCRFALVNRTRILHSWRQMTAAGNFEIRHARHAAQMHVNKQINNAVIRQEAQWHSPG